MKLWKKTIAVSFGKSLEYYDLAVYISLFTYLKYNFFPESIFGKDALFLVWITFALRYIARPIGGAVIGSYADKYGKKSALILISILTGVSTLAIACLPTYTDIGIIAPCLFFTLQLIQAFSYAGESTTAYAFLLDEAKPYQRARVNACLASAVLMAFILTFAICGLVKSFLTSEQMYDFGWRIPLFLGLFNISLSFYLRSKLKPTQASEAQKRIKSIEAAQLSRRDDIISGLKVFFIFAPSTMLLHSSIAMTVQIRTLTENTPWHTMLPLLLKVLTILCCLVSAYIIDRYSDCHEAYKKNCKWMIALGIPIFMIQSSGSLPALITAQFCITILMSVCLGCAGFVSYQAVKSKNCIAVFSVGFNLSVLFFGACFPIAAQIIKQYNSWLVGLLISFGGLCYFAALALDKYTQPASASISTAS
tara:strand:+ start:991 stop:2253 length:1263 start_codon:yes stop_codon:yes gene_type:complete